MTSYSVAEAKNALPRLLDKAIAGEEVVITRRGIVVAELTSRRTIPTGSGAWERLRALRDQGPVLPMTSVELLNAMYEEE